MKPRLLPTTEKVKEYVIPFHRSSLKVFDYAMSKHSMNRLQIVVSSQNARLADGQKDVILRMKDRYVSTDQKE